MTKDQAIQLFQSQARMAQAMGDTKQAISALPEGELQLRYIQRVIGACILNRIDMPKELIAEERARFLEAAAQRERQAS